MTECLFDEIIYVRWQRFLDVSVKGAKAKVEKLIYDRVPSGMVRHGTNASRWPGAESIDGCWFEVT